MALRQSFLSRLHKEIYADRWIFIAALVIYILSRFIVFLFSPEQDINLSLYSIIAGDISKYTIAIYLCVYFIQCVLNKEHSPFGKLLNTLLSLIKQPEKIIRFFLGLFAVTVVMSCFTTVKFIIPVIIPFQFDMIFHEWDVLLHFDYMPWELTHALFSTPYATAVINIAYNFWFFIVWYALFHFLISRHPARMQFLLSYTIIWFIAGNLLATAGSSVGPCFIDKLDITMQEYVPLLERLKEQNQFLQENNWWPIWALNTQDMLWEQYTSQNISIGAGISAMPSVHVAMATLLALAFVQVSRFVGLVFVLYLITIQLGSVHLAWHYAVDGYFAICITIVIWRCAGIFLKNRV